MKMTPGCVYQILFLLLYSFEVHFFKVNRSPVNTEPEDHWSCIAHMSAEDMLKSEVIEEKKFNQRTIGPVSLTEC